MNEAPGIALKLNELRYRLEGLDNALAQHRLGPPGSVERKSFADQALNELSAISTELFALQLAASGNPDVATVARVTEEHRYRIEILAAPEELPGVSVDMTWAEAARHVRALEFARILIDELTGKIDRTADDPLGNAFRTDGPHRAAEDYAREELAGPISTLLAVATECCNQIGTATMERAYPGFDPKVDDPPPEYQGVVRALIQRLAPLIFPANASYIDGNVLKMLGPVYLYTLRTYGQKLAEQAAGRAVVHTLLIGSQLRALAGYAAGLPKGQISSEGMMRVTAMLMTAANGAGYGKIPAGYHKELDALKFYRDAFIKSAVAKMKADT